MRVQFNSGVWTDEEHEGFLRGLEVYGRGSWGAIGIFVPTRSLIQIEAYARQHFVGGGFEYSEEVQVTQRLPSGRQASFSCTCTCSSPPPSWCSSRNGGSGGRLWERPVVAHLVCGAPTSHTQEELYYYHRHNDVCILAVAIGVLDGLMPVANDGEQGQQQQQQQQQPGSVHGEGYQAGAALGNLVVHDIPYPHPLIWEEPALGKALRTFFALHDHGGVL